MNSKETNERFNELLNGNKIRCTQSELEEFIMCGLLFDVNKKYVTRTRQQIKVDVIKTKVSDMDIDFSGLISTCEQLAKENKEKRIYCMSERCYKKYKEQGLIITQNNKDYYRLFDKEKWLVYIIN